MTDLWSSDLTPEILSVAKERVLAGGNIARRNDLSLATKKLILLVVRELNGAEELSQEEEAILCGRSARTLQRRRPRRRL